MSLEIERKSKLSLRERWLPKSPWWKNLLMSDWKMWTILLLCLFGSWSYYHDTKEYREFYERVSSDPVGFCRSYEVDGVWVIPGTGLPLENLPNTLNITTTGT